MTRNTKASTPAQRNTRAAGQMVIAETVESENGKLRARGRHKSVISVRMSSALLDALDVEVTKRKAAQRKAGKSRPYITRTTVIVEALAAAVKR